MIVARETPPVVIEEVTDPVELAKFRQQTERAKQNWNWFKNHQNQVYSHRGQYVCIAGQALFAADTSEEVLATAKAAHPEDDGRFLLRIPRDKM